MGLKIKWKNPGCADGDFIIQARGYLIAVLFWGNAGKPLEGWTPFAYVPIDPYGNGIFRFRGRRAIPNEADCVCAHCVSADFTDFVDLVDEIPAEHRNGYIENIQRQSPEDSVGFSVFSDLHLTTLPWKIRRAFREAESNILLLPGDLTNDGISEQFALLRECVENSAANRIVLSVTGNHDIPRTAVQQVTRSHDIPCSDARQATGESGAYFAFQSYLFKRLRNVDFKYIDTLVVEKSGAYALQIDGINLIGLQCVTEGRKFLFPEGEQLRWLDEHLTKHPDVLWHILLCHAPLLAHNPQRKDGPPYLDRNRELQELLDRNSRIIFLSGHTHISPNQMRGSVEFDRERKNIYIDDGSVVLTDINKSDELAPGDWKDGVITELSISPTVVEVRMKSVISGKNISRGYYRFNTDEE